MEILYDSMSVLEALYDLDMGRQSVLEEICTMSHNYKKTGDIDVLTEGAKDIISFIITGLKKFIQKMKDFVVKNFMILNSYFMEYSKLIDKYGKRIASSNFDSFTVEGFNFTVLGNPKPNTSKVNKIIEDFNANIAKFSTLTIEDIRKINNDECSEVAFSRLRGEVLGYPSRISQEEFKRTCHMYYRNNQEFPEDITINKEAVDLILKNSSALIAEKKAAKIDKDTVMVVLNNMERFFSVKVSDLYNDIEKTYSVSNLNKSGQSAETTQTMSEKEMSKLVMYLSSRYQQVVELSNIISLVFVERMAAIKDQTNQEVQILREVIRRSPVLSMESVEEGPLEEANMFPPTPNPNWAPVWEGISNMGGVSEW